MPYRAIAQQLITNINYAIYDAQSNNCYNLHDIIHREIDEYVSFNTLQQNKEIVENYFDDIFTCVKSYQQTYGDINFNDTDFNKIWAMLAFHCFYEDITDCDFK